MAYRNLNDEEINKLKQQNCSASDWNLISVKKGFRPETVQNTTFIGNNKLGLFEKEIELYPGISKHSGLFNCTIQDSIIEDNVYIRNVLTLAHYHVDTEVVIENVNVLMVTAESNFGNGTEIEILNEAGGRELPIFDMLSSQIAYLLVLYHHDQDFIKKLKRMIGQYVSTKKNDKGYIGSGSKLLNCSSIQNVWIGENARLEGVSNLENGSIVSTSSAPVFIGSGVNARHFIVQSGSSIDGGVILTKCFIGQSVQLGKQYSAENSAFFANGEGFHGEACSIFAGPYTVTHHKSTLLIAGLFSFYNAGSGTNQSNHMYKLGPVHQGILERGSKTGSFCYLLWPSRVGAFTAVIGKHYVNFDSTDFPFSYINEENGKSVLTPAMNLFTVGTRRDASKWPTRDKRKDATKLDIINFDLFNPYTIGKISRGKALLESLYESASKEKEFVQVKGLHIKRLLLKRCSKYYEIAIKIFIGEQFVEKFKTFEHMKTLAELKKQLLASPLDLSGKWLDLAGMIVPQNLIDALIKAIKELKITRISDLFDYLQELNKDYNKNVWSFTVKLISDFEGKSVTDFETTDFIKIIQDWRENKIKLNSMILADAQKEFDSFSQIGFGIDGEEETVKSDFTNVRGTYQDNKFVKELESESQQVEIAANQMINLITKLN